MSYSAESLAPRQALDVGRCVNDAIDVYKQNWVILAISALVVEILVLFSLTLLAGPLCGGLSLMLLRAFDRDDKTVDLGDLFRCFGQFFTFAGLFYLMLVPLVIGTFLCLVPGLLLATFWLFPYYLIIDHELGVFDSLRASKEIVSRKGFGANFALVLITFALSIAPSTIPYLGVVLAWFVSPLAWLMVTSAYIQQVREDDGELSDLFQPGPVTL